jgi:hypothetical protein
VVLEIERVWKILRSLGIDMLRLEQLTKHDWDVDDEKDKVKKITLPREYRSRHTSSVQTLRFPI